MPAIALAVLKLLAVPAVTALGAFLAVHLPVMHAKTKSAAANEVIDAVTNAAIDEVKTVLQGQLLAQLCQALLTGQPLAGPLVALLPQIKAAVADKIGPALLKALQQALGGQANADKRIETAVLAAAQDHVQATLKVVRPLPVGSLHPAVVTVANQQP